MSKKIKKISVTFDENSLSSLISNAAEFIDCSGLDSELFSSINNKTNKFYFTKGTAEDLYSGLIRTLANTNKYPDKTGSEYAGLLKAKKLVEDHYERQIGLKIKSI